MKDNNNNSRILNKFASSVLKGMKSLDSDISQLIDKHFWSLSEDTSEEREIGRSNEELIFEDKLGINVDDTKKEREAKAIKLEQKLKKIRLSIINNQELALA